mgnify:CR=1 FL=1
MLDAVRDRWENRGVRCLNCQKKLVAKEKLVCKECKSQLTAGTIVASVATGLIAAIKSHNKNDKD